MRYFIVHAHHEPKSFNGALTAAAVEGLEAAGHGVEVSDLYAMGFDPVSDRRNFTTVADAGYLKQQAEETYATEHGGFAADVEAEIGKLEACDVLVFQFPLWWFGMPAILKGWCDRVLAMGRVYGGGKWYENGIGKGKLAVVSMTTGGPESMYSGFGLNPGMDGLLVPVHHGVFWFNGFEAVEPFVAWAPARMDDGERASTIERYVAGLVGIGGRRRIPHLGSEAFEVPGSMEDRLGRYVVSWSLDGEPGADELAAERAAVEALRQDGVLIDGWIAEDGLAGGMVVRGENEAAVRATVAGLPFGARLRIDVHLMRGGRG